MFLENDVRTHPGKKKEELRERSLEEHQGCYLQGLSKASGKKRSQLAVLESKEKREENPWL